MKRVLFLAGLLVFLTSGCGRTPETLLIDSFEGEINSGTVDFGSGEGSTLEVRADSGLKRCGKQSLKLEYDLRPSGYMWAARGYGLDVPGAAAWLIIPQDIDWNKYKSVVLYMYGSGSGGIVALDIKDSKGELWRFLLDDDFQGWKRIVCPFDNFFPRGDWQPEEAANDEVLDFPLLSFQFEPRMPGKGVYYFDCVGLSGEAGK